MTIEIDAETVERMTPAERQEYARSITDQVVRFREVRPNWEAFEEAKLPGNERGFYNYVGTGASTDPQAKGVIRGQNLSFSIVVAGPGRGAPLHAHTTEEVFLPLSGQWTVYWGEPGHEEELVLGLWDAVSIPAPVMRGFRNAGTEDAYLLALLGGGAPPPPIYHPSVTERLQRWHPNIPEG